MKITKKRLGLILLALVLAVLIFLGIYLLRPRSFEEVFPFSPSPETNFSLRAVEMLSIDGRSVNVVTKMTGFTGDEGYEAVMEILRSAKYRPRLMNFFPDEWNRWSANGYQFVTLDLTGTDVFMTATLMEKDGKEKIAAFSRSFWLTEQGVLEQLVELCKEYGVQTE